MPVSFLFLLSLCRFRNGVRNSAAIASNDWMVMNWYKRGRNRCQPVLRHCLACICLTGLSITRDNLIQNSCVPACHQVGKL